MGKYSHFLARSAAPYFIVVGSTALLTGLGLVMVLSSSSVKSIEQNGTTYSIFLKQLLFLAIALCLTYIAAKMKSEISSLDRSDIQGLVYRTFGTKPFARYIILTIDNAADAKNWLYEMIPKITTNQKR